MTTILSKLIKQNDAPLHPDIREVGCFFRSSLAIAELTTGHILKHKEINKLWSLCIEKGFIVNRIMVKGGAPVINLAFNFLLGKYEDDVYRAYEIATSKGGVVTYYKSVPKNMRCSHFFISKRRNAKNATYLHHFVLNKSDGSLLFDPFMPDVQNTTEEYTIHFFIKNHSEKAY